MRGRMLAAAVAVAILLPVTSAPAKPGLTDLSFGDGGVAMADFGSQEFAAGLATGKKGTVVVAGTGIETGGGGGVLDIVVARFTKTGRLDKSFSKDGRARVDTGSTELARKVIVQPDGSVVIAALTIDGIFSQDCCRLGLVVVKLKPNGALDRSFAEDGVFRIGLDDRSEVYAFPAGLVRQSNGRIIVGVSTTAVASVPNNPALGAATSALHLIALDRAGALDPTFGTGGMTVLADDGVSTFITDLAVTSSDALLAAYYASGAAADGFRVARFLPEGVLDPTFGPGGLVRTDLGPPSVPTAIAAVGEGAVVAGYSGGGTSQTWRIARYRPDGTLHTGFSKDGTHAVAAQGVSPGPTGVAYRGKRVYVAGPRMECTFTCIPSGAILRLKDTGAIDRTWGQRGWASAFFQVLDAYGLVFSGGKAMTAGTGLGRATDVAVVRFTSK